MKRLILLIAAIAAVATLSACDDDVIIAPDVIDVQFDNIRYDGAVIVVDVWITNGTDEDFDLGYAEFWLELPDGVAPDRTGDDREVCGAGFDFYITVKADDYEFYEVEFTSDYIFLSDSELDALNVDLTDLELYYWFE